MGPTSSSRSPGSQQRGGMGPQHSCTGMRWGGKRFCHQAAKPPSRLILRHGDEQRGQGQGPSGCLSGTMGAGAARSEGGFASTVHSKQSRHRAKDSSSPHSQVQTLPRPRGLGEPIPAPQSAGSLWYCLDKEYVVMETCQNVK